MRLLAFALEVFFSSVRQHDDADALLAGMKKELIRARFDQRDRSGLREAPPSPVGVYPADGGHSFKWVAAVSTSNRRNNPLPKRFRHKDSLSLKPADARRNTSGSRESVPRAVGYILNDK